MVHIKSVTLETFSPQCVPRYTNMREWQVKCLSCMKEWGSSTLYLSNVTNIIHAYNMYITWLKTNSIVYKMSFTKYYVKAKRGTCIFQQFKKRIKLLLKCDFWLSFCLYSFFYRVQCFRNKYRFPYIYKTFKSQRKRPLLDDVQKCMIDRNLMKK